MKRGLLARNVAALVDRVPSDPGAGENRRAWQTEEAVAFLRHVRDDPLAAAWTLSLLGMRRGEVLGLRWADVDLDGSGTCAAA